MRQFYYPIHIAPNNPLGLVCIKHDREIKRYFAYCQLLFCVMSVINLLYILLPAFARK